MASSTMLVRRGRAIVSSIRDELSLIGPPLVRGRSRGPAAPENAPLEDIADLVTGLQI